MFAVEKLLETAIQFCRIHILSAAPRPEVELAGLV